MGAPKYPRGYGEFRPASNYRPWELDSDFLAIYKEVADHTMVDQCRCHSLYQLLQQALRRQQWGGGVPRADVLEVGVWRGGTGALLSRTVERTLSSLGNHPDRSDMPTVWLADTFAGVVKAGVHDPYYRGGEHANTSEETVRQLFESMKLDNYRMLSGTFPEQTGTGAVAERGFCFCHIDVDVYQSAKDVLYWVWPRLQQYATVVFDDYGFYGCEGVTRLVDEERGADDRLFIHNLNGQGVFFKLK